MDVVHHFVTNLSPTIQDGLMNKSYNYNKTTSSKLAYDQILELQQAFALALLCEKLNEKISSISDSKVKSSQALIPTSINGRRAEATISR